MTTIGNRPPGTPQVIPYLYYADADAAFAFLQEAFGFTEHHAVRDRDGSILTAQLSTGDALVMVGPGMAGFGTRGVGDPAWASARMFTYVDDVDAHCERARAAGATIVSGPGQHLSDNRIYVAADSGGHQWIFATRTEA